MIRATRRNRAAALLTTALAAMSTTAGWATQPCPGGAVGYWPMEGDGTEIVNGFPGAVVNNVTFAPGQVGQAASFDGALSYIDAGAHPEISAFGGTELSFSAWLYPLADPQAGAPVPGNDDSGAVITARTNCNEGNYQFYSNLFGDRSLYTSKWYSGDESFFYANVSLPLGSWSHVVATIQDGTARFYVDGALVAELFDDGILPINALTQNVQIGWDSCGSYYVGMIDELAVWDRALLQPEIDALHAAGLDGTPLCSFDGDGDGVADGADVCPSTEGSALVDGCDCSQILAFQPGATTQQCSAGTLNIFTKRIGWAKGAPRPNS